MQSIRFIMGLIVTVPRIPGPACKNEDVFTRFLWAMGVYAVLAAMAAFTLDGKMRAAVWIFLGGLAVKTLIAYKAPR